jgi:hypothetical protein
MVRVGATNFAPKITLYDPANAVVAQAASVNAGVRDVFVTAQATNAGSYTIVVSATFANQTGGYGVSLAVAPGAISVSPGDEGGALTNGVLNTGTMLLGDLDVWSFNANAGDGLMIRMGTTNFSPWIRLYGPNGALVQEAGSANGGVRDTYMTLSATNSGTYTVVVSAAFVDQFGGYSLNLAQVPEVFTVSPGEQGGILTNGFLNAGTISLGDLDMWKFEAKAGDGIMLRMGATNFAPWIRLYGPNGAMVQEAGSANGGVRDTFMTMQITNAGTYTAVVGALFVDQFGTYGLTLAQAPEPFVISPAGAGGELVDGVTNSAVLNLGDLDMWSFYGTPGDSNALRVAAVNFAPWIRLYGPDGSIVQEVKSVNGGVRNLTLNQLITTAGIYTVVISATFVDQFGTYTFKQSRWAPDLLVPVTQTIDEGATLTLSISAQDPDQPIKPLQFALLSKPNGMSLALNGATNATISWATGEADGPSTNVIIATVTDFQDGKTYVRTNSFTVVVNEINLPPQLTVPANQIIDELTPLAVSASATDPDIPANTLTFSLNAAPAGMTIDPNTGAISWVPTETQGPSTNTVVVVVTDDNPWAVNAQHLSATNSFTVLVREINTPPQLTVPGSQTVDELTPLNVSASATDSDIPANALTFSLLNAPQGMTINPATGAIAWTPTEAQGPSTNMIAVVVTDFNPLAANAQHLSVTDSFTVIVREVNSAPTLQSITNQTVHFGNLLSVQASASDSDIPANVLTFSLDQPPQGMVINAATGLITWTPLLTQVGTFPVTVRVTDNGVPSLSATTTFNVTVTGNGASLALNAVTSTGVQLTISGDIGHVYELQRSQDLSTWSDVTQITLSSPTAPYTDPEPSSISHVFYRLKMLQ